MKRSFAWLAVFWAAAGFCAEAKRTVIFVCEKGSVKSVLAAAQFNQMAQQQGLPFVAVPRGTRAGEVVPEKLIEAMKADGLEPTVRTSQQLAASEAREAAAVVTMCELPAELAGGATLEAWSDIPPVTVDYAKARDALAARVAPLTATLARTVDPRPNILLVVVDDLRFDDFGAAGHPFARTVHLDRIAREGAQFRNFFAVTPLCSPSRANILTGLETRHHGILDNTDRSARSHELPTFARSLQAAGYATGFIGKWHMGNDPTPRPGFEYWVAMKGQGEVADPELFERGRLARAPGYVTDIFTDRALDFIAQPRRAPFMLMLSHKALHPNSQQRADGSITAIGEGGFIPAARHKSLYEGETPPRRANYAVPPFDKPALMRAIPGLKPLGPETVTPDETIRDRLRMLAAVDEGLGRILAALEKQGSLDRTVVMVIGDNGYFYGEHGLSEERRLAYEESIRLPLLLRYPPQVRAGATPAALALTTDLAPTILELAGAAPRPETDGRSLLPLFAGEPADWRRSFLIEYTSDTVFPRMLRMGYDAVRTTRHKLIRYRELAGMDELYDLENDPFELHNLIASPDAAALRREMEDELGRHLARRPAQ